MACALLAFAAGGFAVALTDLLIQAGHLRQRNWGPR
jgi:hypothetical protein